jgi:hypothetical protein
MLPIALAADLALLAEAIETPNTDLTADLDRLMLTTQDAVPNCHGLSITIASHGHPVTFTVLVDGIRAADVRSSVLLPLPRFTKTEPGSSLVLFGTEFGCFVDLAEALSAATSVPVGEFELDAHIEVAAAMGAPTGLAELATINQAIGIMIGHGVTPDEAVARIHGLAVAATDSVHSVARRIVAAPTVRPDDHR